MDYPSKPTLGEVEITNKSGSLQGSLGRYRIIQTEVISNIDLDPTSTFFVLPWSWFFNGCDN